MRLLAIACVGAAILAGAVWAAGGDEEPFSRESCAANEERGTEQFNALLRGKRPKPYGPYNGRHVVDAFRRAGFLLPAENELWSLYEYGLNFPDICDFRWFSETNPFDAVGDDQGTLKVFVVSTPANAAFEHRERIRLAKKYTYSHAMQVFRQGNVVVEYYFKLRDGRAVERNRLADVRRVLVAL